MPMENRGFVYIAGSGPSQKDYITLKAYAILQECDCVIYDALIDSELLSHTRVDCEKIYVGKIAGSHYASQEEINALLVQKAKEYPLVLRLKGGDPFVFGRGGEEAEALIEAGIDFELIPGVTSAIAVPEMAGIPVTHRGVARSVTVVTGHTRAGRIDEEVNFQALANTGGTLVFLMGLHNVDVITAALLKEGMDPNTNAAVISNGTKENAYTLRASLKDLASRVHNDPKCVTPAIIVIGETSGYHFLSHYKRPLSHISATVIGTNDFTNRMGSLLKHYGASCHSCPIVKIQPIGENRLKEELASLNDYTMLVFTSRNTIRLFFEAYYDLGYDVRKLASLKIAVIGEATATYLKEYHFQADYVPEIYTSKGLGELLCEVTDAHDRLLIPRAKKGNDVLSTILTKANRSFNEFALYDTLIDEPKPQLCEDDYLIFASSQGLKGYFDQGGQVGKKTRVICIGPYTAQMAERYEIRNFVLAKEASRQGILETILEEVKHAKI
jgi:uroporphyrinogen III methyltransferase/synthase